MLVMIPKGINKKKQNKKHKHKHKHNNKHKHKIVTFKISKIICPTSPLNMLYTINQTKNKNNKHKITKTIIRPPRYINIGLFLSTEIRQVDDKRLPVKKPCSKTGEPLYRKNCKLHYNIHHFRKIFNTVH